MWPSGGKGRVSQASSLQQILQHRLQDDLIKGFVLFGLLPQLALHRAAIERVAKIQTSCSRLIATGVCLMLALYTSPNPPWPIMFSSLKLCVAALISSKLYVMIGDTIFAGFTECKQTVRHSLYLLTEHVHRAEKLRKETYQPTGVIKQSRLNILAQDLTNSSPVAFLSPYTHLSHTGGLWSGCRQAGWQSPLRQKREVTQHLHFTHTVRLAWWCHATVHLSHPWGCALGQPVRQASALVREGGTYHLAKERKKDRKKERKKPVDRYRCSWHFIIWQKCQYLFWSV